MLVSRMITKRTCLCIELFPGFAKEASFNIMFRHRIRVLKKMMSWSPCWRTWSNENKNEKQGFERVGVKMFLKKFQKKKVPETIELVCKSFSPLTWISGRLQDGEESPGEQTHNNLTWLDYRSMQVWHHHKTKLIRTYFSDWNETIEPVCKLVSWLRCISGRLQDGGATSRPANPQ
jgi:hypothetical protein